MIRWAVPLLLLPCCACADDSAISAIGGNIKMMRGHRSIRMVSEDVHVTLPQANVRAVFVFHNDGPATTVKIGFPETGSGGVAIPGGTQFGYFRSYVDGQRVRVKREVDKSDDDGDYHIWWTKTVHFGRHQTHVIVNEYQGGLGGSTDNQAFFTYVLATGSSWKGSIGHARITVDASGLGRVSDLTLSPDDGQRHARGKLVWVYDDLEPTEDDDIHVNWWNGFKDIWVNGGAAQAWTPRNGMGNRPPEVVGNDVLLPIRAAAAILHCELKPLSFYNDLQGIERKAPRGTLEISSPIRWCRVTPGSKVIYSGPRPFGLPHRTYVHRGEDGSASLMIELRPLVTALGGKSWWDKNGLHVKLP